MDKNLNYFDIEKYNKCCNFINNNFDKISNMHIKIKRDFFKKYMYVQKCNKKMYIDLFLTGQIEDSIDILKRFAEFKKKYIFFEKSHCFLIHIQNFTDIILNNNRGDINELY